MNTSKTFLLFALVAVTGCSNTQIVGHRVTEIAAGPYRKVLVCSMDTEAYRRLLEENAARRELEKLPIAVMTCSDFFGDMRSLSDKQVQSRFELAGFDAVLAWHRRPIIQAFVGPGKAASEPLSLAGLLQAYRRRVLDRSDEAVRSDGRAQLPIQDGRQTVEQGEVSILDARSGRPVWEGRGAVLASTDAPPAIAAAAMAKTAVHAFINDGLIPQS